MARPRLISALRERWDHRVTLVVGGPGFGKTTLLLQAIAENRLEPRGQDIWTGVEPQDVAGESLACATMAAVSASRDSRDDPVTTRVVTVDRVADAVWRRSPTAVCLVFDDVHLLPAGSDGARWLSALVEGLPANAHVVLAGRAEPSIPLARLGAQGAVRRLTEEALRFSPDELVRFATRRGIDPERLADTGGWPAVAELAASVDRRLSEAYLWEEVLEPLGARRRHLLAVLSDLGGADDRLAAAALGRPVTLADELEGVPLVAEAGEGWHVPHALWRRAPGIALSRDDRAAVRRRAVAHLQDRGLVDEAFVLIEGAELWEEAPALLRTACLSIERLTPNRIDRWLAAIPPPVRASPAGRLAAALQLSLTAPAEAVEPLRAVAKQLRADGDVAAELTAIAVLGRLAWTGHDLGPQGAELAGRLMELDRNGHAQARGLAGLLRAMDADFRGDDAGVLAALDTVELKALDPAWEAIACWMRGLVHLDQGDADAADEMVARVAPTSDIAVRAILGGLRLRIGWANGLVDQVLDDAPAVLADIRAAGGASIVNQGMVAASTVYSHIGDVRAARRCLDEAGPGEGVPAGRVSAGTALAMASLQLAEGHEEQAEKTVRDALGRHPGAMGRGVDRHMWRHLLALSYVLVPETRAHWNRVAQRGYLAASRELAAAVVAARAGSDEHLLRDHNLSDLDRVRAGLHVRFAAELAVALADRGRPEGPALLDALGPVGREAVRSLGAGTARTAKPARSLLAAVPAPPQQVAHLAVLGRMVLRRERAPGTDVAYPDLGRKRLRALLAFLVTRRTTDRATVMDALWPDLDERAASNNLAVTLTYVLQALEPSRTAGEPPYLVRWDSQSVWLVTGSHLRIDTDRFDHNVAEAARAEADGTPSVALDHNLAAVDLYRGDLFSDVPEAAWMVLDREHYRIRFVSAAIRAGQLLLGRGDTDKAETMARRALDADPWSEDAYAVLVASAVANGNRSGAHRLLEHCGTVLADLGVEPSEATRQLRRRVQSMVPVTTPAFDPG